MLRFHAIVRFVMIRRLSFFVFCFLALLPNGKSHAYGQNQTVQGSKKEVIELTAAGPTANIESSRISEAFSDSVSDHKIRYGTLPSASLLPLSELRADLITNPVFLWGVICLQALAIGGLGYYFWKMRRERIKLNPSDSPTKTKSLNREFLTLSHAEQFARLQDLALFAVQQYPLELSRITKLAYQTNASFMVEALHIDTPEEGIQKYYLRIFGPGYETLETIESEMQWLAAILRDTDLTVPEPLANRERQLVTTLHHSGFSDSRLCTMVSWLEGASPMEHPTEEILEDAGVFLGKLHQQVVGYKPHSAFERKTWDLSGLHSEMLEIPVTKIRRALNKDLIDLVDSATAKIQSAIEGIEQHREVYGLIHGNLLLRNFLVHGGEIRVVDFDHCGWGFFGYDLAVTLSQLVGQPKSPQLRAAFLKGYQQVRLVGAEIESLLGVFIGARYVYEILRLAGNKNDDDTEKETLPQIKRYSEYLERFLQRR